MGSMTRSVAGSTKLARRSLGRVQTPSLQSERTDDVVRRSSPFTSRRRQRQQLDERSPREAKPRQRVPSGKSSAFSSPYTVQRSQPLSITLRAIGVGLTLSAAIRTTGATVGVATKFPGKPSRSGSLLTTTVPSMYDKPLLEHRVSCVKRRLLSLLQAPLAIPS
ncbi:unnamed protein product [Dicrocoelium dendriticum]|nr:unnamed protein product [Dicrocoelium dendriticum]